MNGRRSFVKGVGLLSALFAGGAVARAQAPTPVLGSPNVSDSNIAPVSEAVDPAIVKQLEEQSTSSLALTQTYGVVAPPPPPQEVCRIGSNGYMFAGNSNISPALHVSSSGVCINGERKNFVPGSENHVNVRMVPGPDGELYLNINGQWKRVLTA